ncbi:hypothetical protein MTO96_021863 [Rhipicephalus appendiculatus]
MDRPAPPQRRGASPQPKVKETQVEEPKAEQKPRALPLEPVVRPAPPQRRGASPQPKRPRSVGEHHLNPRRNKSHVRFLLNQWFDQRHRSVGDHRLNPRWKKSHVRFLLNQFPDQRLPQRRRTSPQPKEVEEKSRALPLAPMPRPVPPAANGRASPQPKEVEEKSRALPLEPNGRTSAHEESKSTPVPSDLRPRRTHVRFPMSERPGQLHRLTRSSEGPQKQPAVSVCHEVHRHRKQVAAACSDVECMPSSHVTIACEEHGRETDVKVSTDGKEEQARIHGTGDPLALGRLTPLTGRLLTYDAESNRRSDARPA